MNRRALLQPIAAALMACAALASLVPASARASGVVNIYSYREPKLIEALLYLFSEKHGIKTNIIYARNGLVERMAAEGANSPADVLLSTDIGRLADAKAKGITQPVSWPTLADDIPAQYRDPDGHWIGLTMRARVIFASKARVKQDTINYEDLADPKWKGRICSRSGQHTYNVDMLASLIAHLGADKAEAWARGVKNNLARKPAGGDRDQARAIFSGQCDLAIANTYYMAAMQTNARNPEQQQWAAAIKLLFPNSDGRGSHVNISGAALARHAPNKANGLRLIEFLASAEAQKIYSLRVSEYPLRPGVSISGRVRSWGTLKADTLPLTRIAELRKAASMIMDKVAFDAGPDR